MNKSTPEEIIKYVGGKDNINYLTNCMTRLRFNLKDNSIVDEEGLKSLPEVIATNKSGGQYQIIVGQKAEKIYNEINPIINDQSDSYEQNISNKPQSFKDIINAVFDYLSGSLTPLIPILLTASLAKTVAAIVGPSLLDIVSETSDIFVLFNFAGDAGFYFLPIFIGYSAARKLNASIPINMLLGALLLHPTFVQIAESETAFSVFGIPTEAQVYASTVVPMLLIVWISNYIENIFDKYSPDILKVFLKPFGTFVIMLPIALTVLAPLGGYVGVYVGQSIIALNDLVGPLAVAVIGGTFSLLVLTGMHPILFTYLFVTFPEIGYDNFLLPGILAASWTAAGVALACVVKFKSKENKSLTLGYIITWLLGGVGEPLLYGLSIPYKTPLIAGILSGFITGLVAGIMNLTAYVLNTSNGIYGLAAFIGGETSNYIALGVTLIVAIISGFLIMYFMKLDENITNKRGDEYVD